MGRRKTATSFVIPVIWREPNNYIDKCSLRCVSVTGFAANNKHNIVWAYANLNYEMWPIPHDKCSRFPESTENGLAFLDQNVKTVSPVAIPNSSDYLHIPEQRTS